MSPNTYVATVVVACALFLAWSIAERFRYEMASTQISVQSAEW
ncbi:hypothetical protein QBD01_001894 [Ochrobactrum sp. 19YEA23]|nr:hypothetical protein [Ochrobactrum sp. 19YEA23]